MNETFRAIAVCSAMLMGASACDRSSPEEVPVSSGPPIANDSASAQKTVAEETNTEVEGSPRLPPAFVRQTIDDREEAAELARMYAEGSGDLKEGMEFFQSTPLFDEYTELLSRFAARLALEDPEAGLRWLVTLDAMLARRFAISAFGGRCSGTPRILWRNSALCSKLIATAGSITTR